MANRAVLKFLANSSDKIWWSPGDTGRTETTIDSALARLDEPVLIVNDHDAQAAAIGGRLTVAAQQDDPLARPVAGFSPPLGPEDLGDASFRADHGLRYAYVAGAMANGIASTQLVDAMGRAGMVGFFGAAGLSLERVEAAIDVLSRDLSGMPYGFNLIQIGRAHV